MKIRIGLITEDKSAQGQIKQDFSGIHIYQAANVMDFYQVLGNNKVDAIVFAGGEKLEQEFTSYYIYLRQKPQLKTIPIAVLTYSPLINRHPLPDPLVRCYSLDGGLFLPLIGFFNAAQVSQFLAKMLETKKVETAFATALSHKMGQGADYIVRPATDEECHSEFFVQHSDEIASNLLWLKYSARILTKGSEKLILSLQNLSDDEQQQLTAQILSAVFVDFNEVIEKELRDEGAFFFVKSEAMPAVEKTPFIKRAKSQTVVFESPSCLVMVEFIRYL